MPAVARPPVIAAGINLFGGPLGLLHRHVTGAIPIRRDAKDPAYLVTLKAYIAETLKRHDLLFYIEGGRSYTGEMKPPKTGLLHATMQSHVDSVVIVPTAVSYDLVLEDHILPHLAQKRRSKPFARELADMVRYAVGYESRAFVTFGPAIRFTDYDPHSRRDVLDLAHRIRDSIGRLHKVLPTALVAATRRAAEEGYQRMDAYTPFPIEELDDVLLVRHTALPLLVLIGGLVGCAIGYGLQYYSAVIAYPVNVGGRPVHSWPAFIPPTFEMTILVAALTAVLGMLGLNGLPTPYHPVFNVPGFALATRDLDGRLRIDPRFEQCRGAPYDFC